MSIQQDIQRWRKLKTDRGRWEQLWQELAEVLHPVRADITTGTQAGEQRHDQIYDGTPMRARRSLATTLDGLMKPKTKQWFNIVPQDDELADIDEVKHWLETVEELMWSAIYAREARFVQRTGEVDDDLVTFGVGVLFIGERANLGGLKFRSVHPKQITIGENSDGVVDTVFYEFELTARQAMQKFGDAVSQDIRDADSRNSEDKFQFLQKVCPRDERKAGSLLNKDLPFASKTYEVKTEHEVEDTGFHEFPFAIPRWDTATGEVYGRSPGMVALPDSKTLQAMGKTMLVAGQKAVDPPLWALDDSIIGAPRTFPGGVTIIDGEAARSVSGQPFGAMQFGANLPLGLEMQNQTRTMVEAAFFRNVFNLPIDGPQMTATEVIQRKEEFIREIGPVFGRLETDYIGHIVERVFGIMFRANAFPEPPEELFGREIKFEFQSPIQQARKQIESMSISNAVQALAPIIEFQPEVMDNFNGDEIMRDTPEGFGVPAKWLRTVDERDALRQQRIEAQQAQQELDQAQQAADVASKVA